MKRLALTLIVKDEVTDLDRCLNSIYKYVDGIFVLHTGVDKGIKDVCDKYKAVYEAYKGANYKFEKKAIDWLKEFCGWETEAREGDEVFLFDQARNKALSMIPKDFKWMMWLDADDVVKDAQNIPQVLDRMEREQATAVFINYLYDVIIENGQIKQILIQHLRERILLNDGRYKWVAPIHETLIAENGYPIKQIESKEFEVVHLAPHQKKTKSISRNIHVLEKSIFDSQGKDPRPLYYLAKAYYDLHTDESHRRAEKLIYRYLKMSGWAEERAQAYEYLAEIFRGRKELNKSTKALMNALIESPKFPSVFLSMALTCLQQGKNDDAMFWVKLATQVPNPQTTLVVNPRDLVTRALEVIFNVSLKQNNLDEAWASIFKLKEIFPNDKNIDNQFVFLSGLRQQREVTKQYVELAKTLKSLGEGEKLKALASAAPKLIEGNPIVADFIKQHKPAKVWPKKSVVIYCGAGWTVWNPKFLKQKGESFIGGSEEAVIYASKELEKQGHEVTVYGDPGEEGKYNGVTYLNHFKFNPKDEFDILIGWRLPQFFDVPFTARKTYLWLHDVPNTMDYTKERLDRITKIMVLSKAQRDLLPNVAESKFLYTSNGFVEEFPRFKPSNNPNVCIYTSSYDRGLQHLMDVWPDVVKAVPKAKLRVFYGTQLFDKMFANNPERMAWRDRLLKKMADHGVYHGGRLTQEELEKEYKQAGLWVYPTDFYEISCISAIKAQAFGAVPVCINYAALKETVKYGVRVDGDIWDKDTKKKYTEELIKALNTKQDKKEMMKFAKDKYSWRAIISLWTKEFNATV